MSKQRLLLLRTLLLSTSRINKIKYSDDKKLKNKAVGGFVGMICLLLMIVAYSVAMCVGYGRMGLANAIPVLCAAIITVLAFVFTFFKTNGYLFAFKEYDMLMALPFSPKTIAADKFLYMYLVTLPWYVAISISMMVVYGLYIKPGVLSYFFWVILTFVMPVIPMLFASFIGFIIAKLSVRFQRKNIAQTVLTFLIIIFCFSLQYIIEAIVKSKDTKMILSNISDSIEGIGKGYLPIAWFCDAVRTCRVADFLLLTGVSLFAFEIIFMIFGVYYRQINSALKSHAASKEYKMTAQKKHSVLNAIAYKEFKRLTGSTIYLTNAALGEILASILGIAALFVKFDTIVFEITKGAPFSPEIVYPAIPLIVYFFIGMVATTACSPSLEGKNYWIMQSLPIEKKVIFQGKMLFHLYLSVPFAVFATVCLCYSASVSVASTVLYVVQVIALCMFSSAWGCVCGMKFMRLDWENEIEVVKQGGGIMLYLFPNMFACMGLVVLVVYAGMHMSAMVISLIITAIALLLAAVCYGCVMKMAKEKKV